MSEPIDNTSTGAGVEGTSSPSDIGRKGLFSRLGDSIKHNKNALMLATGLAVGAGSLPAVQGCAYETGPGDGKPGTHKEAILSDWPDGQTGQYSSDPSTTIIGNMKYRTFVSNREGAFHGYISKYNDPNACPNSWCPPVQIGSSSLIPVNETTSNTKSVRYYEYQGNGQLMTSNDRLGSPDIYHFDYNLLSNEAINGAKVAQISQDLRSEEGIEISADGTLMLYTVNMGGSNTNIFQVDLPTYANPIAIIGLNTATPEGYPFFYGSEDKIAFATLKAGSTFLGSNIFVAPNYKRATHSVGTATPLDKINSNWNDATGDTDSNGETCISVETDPGDGGAHQWVIKCDPTLPGPAIPDGGVGGAGGASGAAGAGGTINTGGTAGTGGVAGQGGAEAGVDADTDAEIDGAAGMAGQAGAGGTINTGGTAGTGGVAGQGGAEAGVDADTDAEIDGAAGMAGQAGAGGTINTGGSGGVAGSAGEGGKAGAGGTAGEGGKGGTAGAGGGLPECPITVTVNSGNCEVVNCSSYAQGGISTLQTTGDCTFTDPQGDIFHITGTGPAYLDLSELTAAQSVKVELTHPTGNPKVAVGYQSDHGSNVWAGTLGTKFNMEVQTKDSEKGVYLKVTESASNTWVCNANKDCVDVNFFEMGAGPGVVTEGKDVFMSFKQLDDLASSIGQQPDAGPNTTPPAETGDGGGCNYAGKTTPSDVNGLIFGMLVAAGVLARRRKEE